MNKLIIRPIEPKSKDYASLYGIDQSFCFVKTQINFSCFVAVKNSDNDYEAVFMNMSCRSYMGEALFHLKARKFFPKTSSYNNPNCAPRQFLSDFNYLEGDTHIGLINSKDNIKNFVYNFDRINKIEKEFNIPLSTFIILEDNPNIVMVTGSGMWKDSCWKIQLYTYMLKTLFYNEDSPPEYEYMDLIKENYNCLFGNIKMSPEEEVFDVEFYSRDSFNRHTGTGFVSICQGYNYAMSQVLGLNIESRSDEEDDNYVAYEDNEEF